MLKHGAVLAHSLCVCLMLLQEYLGGFVVGRRYIRSRMRVVSYTCVVFIVGVYYWSFDLQSVQLVRAAIHGLSWPELAFTVPPSVTVAAVCWYVIPVCVRVVHTVVSHVLPRGQYMLCVVAMCA